MSHVKGCEVMTNESEKVIRLVESIRKLADRGMTTFRHHRDRTLSSAGIRFVGFATFSLKLSFAFIVIFALSSAGEKQSEALGSQSETAA